MRRLRKYSESLGGNYSWRVVSSCEQNSMQAIATNDDILIYDPKDGLYCRQSEVVKNGDLEAGIFDIFTDDTGEIKRMVMRPAKGEDFNKFAAEWDALQKEDRPDIIKTKKTTTFAFNTNESGRRMRRQDQGMDELVVDWYKEAFPTDTDMFEDIEEAGSTFADVWNALDNGEDVYAVIGADDSIVRERVFEHLAELTGKDYDVIYDMWMDAAYDYVDDFGEPVKGGEAQVGEGRTFKPIDSAYLDDDDPDFVDSDEEEGGYDPDSYDFQDSWERRARKAEKMGKRVCWRCDSIFKPEGDEDMCPKCQKEEEQRMMNKKKLSESHDNLVLKPCPKCGGEAQFETVDDFPWVGGQIECADCGHHVYEVLSGPDEDRSRDEMMDILVDMWNNGEDLYGEETDDDVNDWSGNEEEFKVKWIIDDEVLGIEIGDTETVVVDLDYVDSFEELVRQATMELKRNHNGMRFDYDVDWLFPNEEELLKRFGYTMNESDSSSSNGTIEVKLRATSSHYGKNIERGDERTITLDPSKAPTIYDEEDLMAWIAEVATEQLPGGGSFNKWSFETISPPDDVIIKAVKGEEGFGPDVEFDPETDEPEDIPDEVSYADALKYFKKMRKAYDDRRLNYEKYGDMRDKLVSSTVNGLLKTKSLDELADEWFKDYGTANGWGWRTSFNYSIAYELHGIHKKKHPEQHESLPQREHWRGWHEDNCSCGFCSSSDSSD